MVFTALLDTNVLWPSLQRDFLLSLAIERLYRPAWNSAILEELQFHEAQKLHHRHGIDAVQADAQAVRLIRQMREAFEDAEISGWEPLDGTYGLPDPDDEHVVAAAHVAGAGAIVTSNIKDFPAECLPPGVDAIRPHQFALDATALNSRLALSAVATIASRSGVHGPKLTLLDIINTLESRYGMGEAMSLVRRERKRE